MKVLWGCGPRAANFTHYLIPLKFCKFEKSSRVH